ncbi:hypothetical protein HanIR_Chr05g0214811 [Helianthus annuus]|nr:hypothetical protein HanIR_Chr05g0214811 [Helianthus annuus]
MLGWFLCSTSSKLFGVFRTLWFSITFKMLCYLVFVNTFDVITKRKVILFQLVLMF